MIYQNNLGYKNDIIDWLMSSSSPPPVRFQTSIEFSSEGSEGSGTVTRADIKDWHPLKKVLDLQNSDGGFPVTQKGKPGIPTLYALILMSKCGLDCSDEPVRKAIEYIKNNHTLDGVISWNSGGSGILPCYAGVTASHIAKMSCGKNDLVNRVAEWIVNYQRFDHKEDRAGGDENWSFHGPSNFGCWQSVSCYHGVVASLALLSSIPLDFRTSEIKSRIKDALRYLEIHKVFRKTTTGEPMFRHLTNFFIFGQWRMNLLDIVEIILDAEPEIAGDQWIQDAIYEIDRHTVEGRILHKTDYRTFLDDPIELEPMGVPSFFLTLQWMKIQKKVKELTS